MSEETTCYAGLLSRAPRRRLIGLYETQWKEWLLDIELTNKDSARTTSTNRMRLYVRPADLRHTPLVKITKPKLIALRTSLKERNEPIGKGPRMAESAAECLRVVDEPHAGRRDRSS